jgi:hypothetical protein
MKIIDLHGTRHKDVPHIIFNACATYDTPFVVITGVSTQMKEIVSSAAANSGLAIRDFVGNPGRVVLYENR